MVVAVSARSATNSGGSLREMDQSPSRVISGSYSNQVLPSEQVATALPSSQTATTSQPSGATSPAPNVSMSESAVETSMLDSDTPRDPDANDVRAPAIWRIRIVRRQAHRGMGIGHPIEYLFVLLGVRANR